jgi:hypothetical protein
MDTRTLKGCRFRTLKATGLSGLDSKSENRTTLGTPSTEFNLKQRCLNILRILGSRLKLNQQHTVTHTVTQHSRAALETRPPGFACLLLRSNHDRADFARKWLMTAPEVKSIGKRVVRTTACQWSCCSVYLSYSGPELFWTVMGS